jgi:hypothetical protein
MFKLIKRLLGSKRRRQEPSEMPALPGAEFQTGSVAPDRDVCNSHSSSQSGHDVQPDSFDCSSDGGHHSG